MGHGRGRAWYTWIMHAGTALLSVFLAGPALAAPPAAEANAAIMARINAADPALKGVRSEWKQKLDELYGDDA